MLRVSQVKLTIDEDLDQLEEKLCKKLRISKDELMEVYEVMKKNQYGQYLKDVMDGKYQEHLY